MIEESLLLFGIALKHYRHSKAFFWGDPHPGNA